jgi:hypothetical protein
MWRFYLSQGHSDKLQCFSLCKKSDRTIAFRSTKLGVGTDKKQKNKSIFNISSLLMDINSVTSGDEIMNKEWRTLIDNADRVCGNHA